MYHFFVTPDQVKEGYIFIIGSDVNHIKNVLRMKPGEKIEISEKLQQLLRRNKYPIQSFPQKSICFKGCQRVIRWNLLFKRQLS